MKNRTTAVEICRDFIRANLPSESLYYTTRETRATWSANYCALCAMWSNGMLTDRALKVLERYNDILYPNRW